MMPPELPPEVRHEFEALGSRFVGWRWETRHGKRTKPPMAVAGGYADATDPDTWSPLEVVLAAVRAGTMTGLGLVLRAAEDGICGIDLDGCRDPATGEIKAWAWKFIRVLNSYTEVSPSGTGVKIYCRADPVPELRAHVRVIRAANGTGKGEKVEVYTGGRYFCVTGQHLADTPEEICDATEALERLVAWISKKPAKDTPPLPASFLALLKRDAKLRAAWEKGEKLGQGGDTSGSGLDASLTVYLARRLGDEDLAAVLQAHPHGQIGSGKLKGKAAERRLERLLAMAAAAREAEAEGEEELTGEARLDLSEDGLALALGRQWERCARHVALWGRWLFWDGHKWETDERLLHMTRARNYLRRRADGLVLAAKEGKIEGLEVAKAEGIAKSLRSGRCCTDTPSH